MLIKVLKLLIHFYFLNKYSCKINYNEVAVKMTFKSVLKV